MILEFTEKFIQMCEEYISKNPDVATSVEEFVKRCGRLGLYNLKSIFGDCSPNTFKVTDGAVKNKGAVCKIYIPDEDYREVKSFLERKGVLRTVISFYYFSILMVLLGYWKLPPKI